ncbi:sensor histidine kinase [Clostridium sp.]|uniref:sensor histidine kinase n=1 Tax=Clostridium sp. TaxID=1506 RepID=UPI003D6CD5CB
MIEHIRVKETKERDVDKVNKKNESEEVFKRIFELSSDPIFVHCAGKIVLANPATEKLFNIKESKDIIGKNVMDFIHPDYIDIASGRINTIYEGGMSAPIIEEKFISSGGTVIDVEIGTSAFQYKNKSAILVIARNINKRKNMERNLRAAEEIIKQNQEKTRLLNQAIEYDQFRTDFFANISHELRTPINVILGTLQLMELKFNELFKENDKKGKVYLKSMKQNCYRLVKLINNLIDVTKIDAGYFEIHLNNWNIVSIIEEITLSVAEYVENNGISLLFDTEMEEKIIACDKDKIERIMLNLISNAIKFTNLGGNIKVIISERKHNFVVSVVDTGIGIPKEKQQSIFERFIRVDRSLTRHREGSGIGLSLVKALVEMHGGKIFLESEIGVGSNFTFEIPMKQLPDSEAVYVNNNLNANNNLEEINIEFSDI